MAQEDQAGEHRHRKGVLRFKPPDVERGDQRADDSAQGRVAAEQDGQQPGPGHHPGQIETDGGDSAEGRGDAFTAAEMKEDWPNMAHAGGNRH